MPIINPSAIENTYQQLESRLAQWAAARDDIRAVVVIGSRSRTDHPADRWSDLDTILFVDDTAVFMQPGSWQRDLEEMLELPAWFAAFDMLTGDSPEWEYVLENGIKVDLSFLPNKSTAGRQASLGEMIETCAFHNVFARGMRPLVYGGPDASLPALAMRPAPSPDQAAFDNLVANILLEMSRAAKMAQRGELWRAACVIDQELQENYLKLLEHHARAGGSAGANTWAYGRFLEEWADPRGVAALPATFARSDWPSVRGALLAGLDLLAWLGPETAARLSLRYLDQAAEPTAAWLRELAAGQPDAVGNRPAS